MRVGIVGAGMVGATAAYAMIMRGVGRDIVLVDKDEDRNRAEAADLLHATPFAHTVRVRAGDYTDLKGSRVVLITAGAPQKPGETRLDLLQKNASVLREILPQVVENAPHAVLVVTTNPVDPMTHLAARYVEANGGKPGQVLGSGTTLDTARFRALLGNHLVVDPGHVHAYVLGEHGDTEVLPWSMIKVAGLELGQYCRYRGCRLDDEVRDDIEDDVRNAAYAIIGGKGSTYYGVGSALARIVDVILNDRDSILTVSHPTPHLVEDGETSVSLPRMLGSEGVVKTFPVQLNDGERKALEHSARTIAEAVAQM
jgi:L-lactate dehydrogenase